MDNELVLTHYYYPGTVPLGNLLLLPKEEAFRTAKELADAHPNTQSFYRFADFENYYPRRMAADAYVREKFLAIGGKPVLSHPFSFVLFESGYLKDWFDAEHAVRIALDDIPEDQISFTLGDSCSRLERYGEVEVWDKARLLADIEAFPGDLSAYAAHIRETCHYIEAQVWCTIPE